MNDLAEIKARLDAASPGPWRALAGERQRDASGAPGRGRAVYPMVLANNEYVLGDLSPWMEDADRDLIVNARRDIERLYDEVCAARFLVRGLLDGREGVTDDARHYLEGTE